MYVLLFQPRSALIDQLVLVVIPPPHFLQACQEPRRELAYSEGLKQRYAPCPSSFASCFPVYLNGTISCGGVVLFCLLLLDPVVPIVRSHRLCVCGACGADEIQTLAPGNAMQTGTIGMAREGRRGTRSPTGVPLLAREFRPIHTQQGVSPRAASAWTGLDWQQPRHGLGEGGLLPCFQ